MRKKQLLEKIENLRKCTVVGHNWEVEYERDYCGEGCWYVDFKCTRCGAETTRTYNKDSKEAKAMVIVCKKLKPEGK